MKTVHVDVKGENPVTVSCPFCERTFSISAAAINNNDQKTTIRRCTCNRHFQIVLNHRRFQRKNVLIVGEAANLSGCNGGWTVMTIMNISRGGLRFRTLEPVPMRVGDKLRVRFTLDTPQDILIDQEVVVRNNRESEFGCEFMNPINAADGLDPNHSGVAA
ncbi:MAG: PilZ domain-containing protein [Desulfofustis sp.]|jgi:hypothetical protein